ncbi:hypothetical protein D3C85_1095030 [compost metagenome]
MQQLIVREVEAIDEYACPESGLLHLSKIILRIAIQYHFAYFPKRNLLMIPQLRRVKRIEIELRMLVVTENLHTQLPLGIVAASNRFVQILRGVANIFTLNRLGFGLL